jgi:hypothetical protein
LRHSFTVFGELPGAVGGVARVNVAAHRHPPYA